MAEYLLAVHMVEGDPEPTAETMQKMYADVEAVNQRMRDEGVWVFAGGLHDASTATVVRNSGDDVVITDGPFVEAKEQLGGFWVLDVSDLDAALAWATDASLACQGPVEVRPFQGE